MSLCGDESAIEVIKAKCKVLDSADHFIEDERHERELEWGRKFHPDIQIAERKQPGEKLSAEEREILAEQHLVAVHTTQGDPMDLGGVIAPTSSYESYDRQTIHWSLNHAVENAVFSNFESRPYTIISKLEDLIDINGVSQNIKSVDTWFMPGIGEGIVVPRSATILEVNRKSDQQACIVFSEDGRILLKDGEKSSEDYSDILGKLVENYGVDEDAILYALVEKHIIRSFGSASLEIRRAVSEMDDEYKYRGIGVEKTVNFHQSRADLDQALADALGLDLKQDTYKLHVEIDSKKHEFFTALGAILKNQETLDRFHHLHTFITEALRKEIVLLEVEKLGGKPQIGGQWDVADSKFAKSVMHTALRIGVGSGNHFESPEFYGESVVSIARAGAA